MLEKRKFPSLLTTAIIAMVAMIAATGNLSAAPPGQSDNQSKGLVELPSGAKGVRGLRQVPEIPVDSIFLRRDFPDHPLGGPPGRLMPPPRPGCDKNINLSNEIEGVVAVGSQDNVICSNADIDTYVRVSDGNTFVFVVQAGGGEAAWTHTDVSDPANPNMVGQFVWVGPTGNLLNNTYTPDIKAFSQGGNNYIVMALERQSLVNAACGVIIYEVNDPTNPAFVSQTRKIDGDVTDNWCDVHNVFVEKDPSTGDGLFIYLTADATNDMRVLDISGSIDASNTVDTPVEVGRYTSPTADNDNYVHDITVVNHSGSVRAYLAYWNSGVVVLNVDNVAIPGVIVGPNVIDPPGFLAHHAFPSQDGSYLFSQDEILDGDGDEPVQMWDISNTPPTVVDTLELGFDVPVNPAHNLEIRYDINPNRLYVGWYKLGLQAWDFDSTGFVRAPNLPPRTAVEYHQAQTQKKDKQYDGAWGVRLEKITTDALGEHLYIFQSDRNYGLIVDCVGCSEPPIPDGAGTVKGTVKNLAGARQSGILVTTNPASNSDMTNNGAKYNIGDVPTETVSMIAHCSNGEKFEVVMVTAGATVTVDFNNCEG